MVISLIGSTSLLSSTVTMLECFDLSRDPCVLSMKNAAEHRVVVETLVLCDQGYLKLAKLDALQ